MKFFVPSQLWWVTIFKNCNISKLFSTNKHSSLQNYPLNAPHQGFFELLPRRSIGEVFSVFIKALEDWMTKQSEGVSCMENSMDSKGILPKFCNILSMKLSVDLFFGKSRSVFAHLVTFPHSVVSVFVKLRGFTHQRIRQKEKSITKTDCCLLLQLVSSLVCSAVIRMPC